MRLENLAGRSFGGLEVIRRSDTPSDADGNVRWLCRCKCGRIRDVHANNLRSGHTTSCGLGKCAKALIDLTGQRFGCLTVGHLTDRKCGPQRYWLCRCLCGGTAEIQGQNLSSGKTRTCGPKCPLKLRRGEGVLRPAIDFVLAIDAATDEQKLTAIVAIIATRRKRKKKSKDSTKPTEPTHDHDPHRPAHPAGCRWHH